MSCMKKNSEESLKLMEDLGVLSDDSDADPHYFPDTSQEYNSEDNETSTKSRRDVHNDEKIVLGRKGVLVKKNACLYCNRRFRWVLNHLVLVHAKEPEVEHIIALEKDSLERKIAIKTLRDRGNQCYNEEADTKQSENKVKKRKTKLKIPWFHNLYKNACFYCNRKYWYIMKHLQQVHTKEPEVQNFMSLEKGSRERFLAVKALKKKGNENYDEEADRIQTEERAKRATARAQRAKKPRNNVLRICTKAIKKSVCFYCKKLCPYTRKHLIRCHSDEPEVKDFLSLPKGSKERYFAIRKIVNRGNFYYNKEIIKDKKGPIIPWRSQQSKEDYASMSPCNYCLGFFNKSLLKHHIEKCYFNKYKETTITEIDDTGALLELTPADVIEGLVRGDLTIESSEVPKELDENQTKRKKKKMAACFYCGKLVTKFVRHLSRLHKDELEVKHILSLQIRGKERYLAIQTIKRKGNFLHNKKVMNEKAGDLIVQRNSDKPESLGSYLPCEHCFGFYKKDTLPSHINKCYLNNYKMTEIYNKDVLNSASERKLKRERSDYCSFLLESHTDVTKSILDQNKFIGISSAIKNDNLVIEYASMLTGNLKPQIINNKIRLLARLVARMNVIDRRITSLKESMKPEYLEIFIKSASKVCSFQTNKKGAVGRERVLRKAIKHCCMIAKSESLTRHDNTKLEEINMFFALLKKRWLRYKLQCNEFEDTSENKCKESIKSVEDSVDTTADHKATNPLLEESNQSFDSMEDIEHCSDLYNVKKSVCLFCKKAIRRLRLHLLKTHSNEPEVKRLAEIEKGSKERALLIKALRNKGDFFHNRKVIKTKSGFIIPKRGRAVNENYSNFLPCEHCYGFFRCRNLKIHTDRCPLNPFLKEQMKNEWIINSKYLRSFILYDYTENPRFMEPVIEFMRSDRIKTVAISDELIMKYGTVIAEKHKTQVTFLRNTSLKMRNLAQLVVDSQNKDDKIKALRDCLLPKNFNYVLSAARERSLPKGDSPIYFQKLGFSIMVCCRIIKNESLVERNEMKLKNVADYMVLFDQQWTILSGDKQIDKGRLGGQTNNKAMVNKIKWSPKENEVIHKYFSQHIKKGFLPGKLEIEECIKQNECLQTRGWVAVKSKICNMSKSRRNKNKIAEHQNKSEDEHSSISNSDDQISSVSRQKSSAANHANDLSSSTNDSSKECVSVSDMPVKELDESNKNIAEKVNVDSDKPHHELNSIRCSSSKEIPALSNEQSIISEFEILPNQKDLLNVNSLNLLKENKHEDLRSMNNESDKYFEKPSLVVDKVIMEQNFKQSDVQTLHNNSLQKNDSQYSASNWDENTNVLNRFSQCELSSNEIQSVHNCCNSIIITEKNTDNVISPCVTENLEAEERTYRLLDSSECVAKSKLSKQSRDHQISEIHPTTSDSMPNNLENEPTVKTVNKSSNVVKIQDELNSITTGVPSSTETNVTNRRKRKLSVKREWTEEEIEAVSEYFYIDIKKGKLPSKSECELCILENECLQSRDWVSVKSKLHCIIVASRKHKPKNHSDRPSRRGNKKVCENFGETEMSVDSCSGINSENEQTNLTAISPDLVEDVVRSPPKKKSRVKNWWKVEETSAIEKYFEKNIENNTVPGKKDCEHCISINPCLASRSWVTVKSKVHNMIAYKKRKLSS